MSKGNIVTREEGRNLTHIEVFKNGKFHCPKCDLIMVFVAGGVDVKRIQCPDPDCGLHNIEFEQPREWLKIKIITGSISFSKGLQDEHS